jgi:hypothetical protein
LTAGAAGGVTFGAGTDGAGGTLAAGAAGGVTFGVGTDGAGGTLAAGAAGGVTFGAGTAGAAAGATGAAETVGADTGGVAGGGTDGTGGPAANALPAAANAATAVTHPMLTFRGLTAETPLAAELPCQWGCYRAWRIPNARCARKGAFCDLFM